MQYNNHSCVSKELRNLFPNCYFPSFCPQNVNKCYNKTKEYNRVEMLALLEHCCCVLIKNKENCLEFWRESFHKVHFHYIGNIHWLLWESEYQSTIYQGSGAMVPGAMVQVVFLAVIY